MSDSRAYRIFSRRKPTSEAISIAGCAFPVASPMRIARQGHIAVVLANHLVVFGGRGVTLDQRKGVAIKQYGHCSHLKKNYRSSKLFERCGHSRLDNRTLERHSCADDF